MWAQKKSKTSITDSLEKALKIAYLNQKGELSDTIKIDLLTKLCYEHLREGNFSRALSLAAKQKAIAENLLACEKHQQHLIIVKRFVAGSYRVTGVAYKTKGDFARGIFYYNEAIKLQEEIKDLKGIAGSYNNLGNVYQQQGDFTKALEAHLTSLKLSEKIKDEKGMASSYNNIGLAYQELNERKKALDNLFRSLEINKRIGNKITQGRNLNNIGIIYFELKQQPLALQYLSRGLEVRKQISDNPGIASNLNSISDCYISSGEYEKALGYNLEGLKMSTEIGDRVSIIEACNSAGEIRIALIKKDPKLRAKYEAEARSYLQQAKKLAGETGTIAELNRCNKNLSEFEYILGNFKQSVENYRTYLRVRDSLFSQESTKKVLQAEISYGFEKKEQNAKLEQTKKDVITLEESKKQKVIRNFFIAGFALMAVLAIFIFRSFRLHQKANHIISLQKREVERQKELVEQKQKQIVDSINYAKRIQESILTGEGEIKNHLSDSFVLYLPKDIVSGDFYWAAKLGGPLENSDELLICTADCTGHGVPGAFLSMIGSTLLNEIVNHNKITDPAQIIKELAHGLQSTLVNKQLVEVNTDGMDISICKINTKQRKLHFAGANHGLYTVDRKGIHFTEAQILSFNGIFGIDHVKDVRSIELNMEPGTMVYLTTDGYMDQIGEEKNKKFLSSRFEKLLTDISTLPAPEQKARLVQNFNDWKGSAKQIDDVLVIGFKI